jgi:DNA-binding SARP family transcriptional activator
MDGTGHEPEARDDRFPRPGPGDDVRPGHRVDLERLADPDLERLSGRDARLRVQLLDGPHLFDGAVSVHLPVRSQRLVALLGLRGLQSRSLIGGYLWPEASEDRARASVRAAVRDLQAKVPGLLVAGHAQAGLHPDVRVDVLRFRALAHELLQPRPTSADLDAGLDLVPGGPLGGELLPGWHDDWAVAEAERLRQLRLHALDALVGHLLDRADHAQALQVALAAGAIDPLRESTHRTVMRVHLAEGNPVEALRQYDRFRSTLRVAMGIEPSQRMLDLVAEIHRTGVPIVPAQAIARRP